MYGEKISVGVSRNGFEAWYDSVSSHAATHIKDTPNLHVLAAEVIAQSDLVKPYEQFHMDMGRVVGESDLVENKPGDEIMYAKRLYRDTFSSFNMSQPPQPSRLVTVALRRQQDETYELVTAWIGTNDSPSFPGTPEETPASKDYWSKHSLAWGSQDIQAGSATPICPW